MNKLFLTLIIVLLAGCASVGDIMRTTKPNNTVYNSSSSSLSGYKYDEASQMIEMCIELNDQDDRLNGASPDSYSYVDPKKWRLVYDSRNQVADDVMQYKQNKSTLYPWHKLYAEIVKKADEKYPNGWTRDTIASDPSLNGFGPWQNAWLLYEGVGKYKGSYTIAIRGTVMSNEPSAVEDVLTNPVSAIGFLSDKVNFVDQDNPDASVHSGFSHATFTLLFDDRYGILRVLNDDKINNTNLYITGHSQGAAMTTLTHSFFHYAMRDNLFGLKDQYKLKSYGFAQPKPGNVTYATDVNRITQKYDNAIVINNDIDLVPMMPLTLQSGEDMTSQIPGQTLSDKFVKNVTEISLTIRKKLSKMFEDEIKDDAEGYGYFYNYPLLEPIGKDKPVSSLNYSSAGHVITVSGTPGDPPDTFGQHHSPNYRKLVNEQLNW